MNAIQKYTIAVNMPFAAILLALTTAHVVTDSLVTDSYAMTLTNARLKHIAATKMPNA